MTRTFRNFLLVMPDTARNEVHHFATNPHTSWIWVADDRVSKGFKRLEEAKADAVRTFGAINWRRKDGSRIRGDYGPAMTPDEYLNRSRVPS